MNNERLKILLDTLVRLTDTWNRGEPGSHCGMIAEQIRFIKKLIREEMAR